MNRICYSAVRRHYTVPVSRVSYHLCCPKGASQLCLCSDRRPLRYCHNFCCLRNFEGMNKPRALEETHFDVNSLWKKIQILRSSRCEFCNLPHLWKRTRQKRSARHSYALMYIQVCPWTIVYIRHISALNKSIQIFQRPVAKYTVCFYGNLKVKLRNRSNCWFYCKAAWVFAH